MILTINQTTDLKMHKEPIVTENQAHIGISQPKDSAEKSASFEKRLAKAYLTESSDIMIADRIKAEKARAAQIKFFLVMLQKETGSQNIDAKALEAYLNSFMPSLHRFRSDNPSNINQSEYLAEKSVRARQISLIMSKFYNPRIHLQDEQQIQETFDLLRFETDLLSLNTADNAWGRDLAEQHWEAIGATRDNYLEVFLKAFEKINAFYADFVALKSSLSQFIGGANDKGEISFRGEDFKKEIEKLLAKYAAPSATGQLFPDAGKSATKEECEQWIKQMGLPAGSLSRTGSGGYTVRIDLSSIEKMKEGLFNGNWSANRLSAWETGFNAQGDVLQNMLQQFTQKMTSANSLYDNLVKIFSSFIEQDLSAAKGYLNF